MDLGAVGGCRPASRYTNNRQTTPLPGSDSIWQRFLRAYLVLGMKLSQLNPAGEHDGFGPSMARAKLPLWSLAAELFYYYFSLKLLLSLGLQHHYNNLAHEIGTLDTLSKANQTTSAYGGSILAWLGHGSRTNRASRLQTAARQEERAALVARQERALAGLQLLGNGYYELGYTLEPVLLFILYIIYLTYMQTRLYVLVRGPQPFAVLRMFFDAERDRKCVIEPQVGRQTARLLGSSLVRVALRGAELSHYREARARCSRLQIAGLGTHLVPVHGRSPRELELAHERLVADVCALGSQGHLVPPNRQPVWREQLAQIYSAMLVGFWVSATGLGGAILLVLPYSGLIPRVRMHNDTWRHLLFQAELLLYGLLGVQWAAFHVIMLVVSLLDQIKFVVSLRGEAAALARDICLDRDRRLVAATGGGAKLAIGATAAASPVAGATLHRRLLRVLILYKLLNTQLKDNQRLVGFVGAMMVIVILLAPVMARLYVAHLGAEMRLVFVAWALFIITTSDFVMIPNCELYARCLDLFRALCYLQAHLDEHRVYCSRNNNNNNISLEEEQEHPCDEHTEWLLRRELDQPELTAHNFATDAFFLRITYKSLLGIHFWCGILLAPMCLQTNTGRLGGSGNLLADSLKIF